MDTYPHSRMIAICMLVFRRIVIFMEGPAIALTLDQVCRLYTELTGKISDLERKMEAKGIPCDGEALREISDTIWERIEACISYQARNHPDPTAQKAPDFLIVHTLPEMARERKRIDERLDALKNATGNRISSLLPFSNRLGISEDPRP